MRAWVRVLATIVLMVGAVGASCTCSGGAATAEGKVSESLGRIRLPEGFTITVFADGLEEARSLALGARGTVFVSTRQRDKVYALVDADGDGKAETRHVVASGLDTPNGVAFRDGALYIAEVSRVLRLDDIESRLADPPQPVVVTSALPSDPQHGWKFIAFGPDGALYVPVGAPCNVCVRDDERYSALLRMQPDGSGLEVYAHGIRNTVGFDWHPTTGELWFTDNGRDRLGDDIPPDELNRAPRAGMHFGFPYCHGTSIVDPEYGDSRRCDEFEPPARELGPHVAALGMRFYTGAMFPERYRDQIFIAEHGSWNRSQPIGYRVSLVTLDEHGRATSYEPFAEGWLDEESGEAFGRPVDVLVMTDGALLVSDDRAGVVYRIAYSSP